MADFIFAFGTEIILLITLFAMLFRLRGFNQQEESSEDTTRVYASVVWLGIFGLITTLGLEIVYGSSLFFGELGSYSAGGGTTILKAAVLGLFLLLIRAVRIKAGDVLPYWLVLIFAVALLSVDHFVLFFIALEGFSLTLYILPVVDKTGGGAAASAKYFAFGTLGSIFVLWGISLLYASHPTLSISDYIPNQQSTGYLVTQPIQFIFAGLLIKLGAVPGHF